MNLDKGKQRQTDGKTDRQTDRRAKSKARGHADIQIRGQRQMNRYTILNRRIDRLTGKWKDILNEN